MPTTLRTSTAVEGRSRCRVEVSAGLAARRRSRANASRNSSLSLGGRMGRLRLAQRHRGLTLDDSPFEEVRLSFRPETQGVEQGEFAEVFFADKSPLDQLVSLLQHLMHIPHTEVPDSRAQQRLNSSPV